MKNTRLAGLYGEPVKIGEKANILSLEIAIQQLWEMVFGFFALTDEFSGRERKHAEPPS